jgi:hypothetical protein
MIGSALASSAGRELKKLERTLTSRLREDALAAGWPTSIVAKLRVVVGRSDIDVSYPDALATAIGDLEYGTPHSNPRPVFRKFARKHSALLENRIAELSIDLLFDSGVLP